MKKVLLALLAFFTFGVAVPVYADDLPEVPADDSTVELPPLIDPADQGAES